MTPVCAMPSPCATRPVHHQGTHRRQRPHRSVDCHTHSIYTAECAIVEVLSSALSSPRNAWKWSPISRYWPGLPLRVRVLVETFHSLGEIVGDSTNGDPALKTANMGFSMGIASTKELAVSLLWATTSLRWLRHHAGSPLCQRRHS